MAEKEIVVFNRGIRDYQTSSGVLKPQTSLALPEKEAKGLLDYSDVIDFEKVSPNANAKITDLEKENKTLKEEVKTLRSEPKGTLTKKRKK